MTSQKDSVASILAEVEATHPAPPIYSEVTIHLLREHGFITESEVSNLRGERITTTQQHRHRHRMPPHFKWGGQIFYRLDDIAKQIEAGRVEPKGKRAAVAAGDFT